MSESHFLPLANDVFALAIWDEGWHSYNNCYLLVRGDRVLLIDTGQAEHFPHLQAALATLGKTEADVTALIATHGHADHIGSAHHFTHARKFIHPADVPLLSPDARELFTDSLPDHGDVQGLTCWRWGDHTPGSCVLHDSVSRVTFAGDPICFFGEALPQGELVHGAPALRESLTSLIAQGELWRDPRIQPERFQRGVAYLSTLGMSHLATGHGVVLRGDLPRFFANLAGASTTGTHPHS
jgi:glyoxylase-like metal-dependent hydrolase (beta-lactamase superfamily II)